MLNSLPASLTGLASLAKYTAALLVLLNIRSFPFAWHLRVFAPLISLRAQYYFLCFRMLFASKKHAAAVKQKWLDGLSPVGQNPLALQVRHRAWAGPDDCDYNFHLSNSCYPKIMDGARLKAALATCPTFFRLGGWMALGATHHHFIREIPIFAHYEVRIGTAAWDQKWVFIVSRFVTKGKGKRHAPESAGRTILHTPATPLDTPSVSGTATPARIEGESKVDAQLAAVQFARAQAAIPEPDGATLHCVAVSVMCFKHGRITVPPGVALACEGLCTPPEGGAQAYSHANPPPSWTQHAQALRTEKNVKEYVKFVRGGWKEVPEGQRWWEEALGGEVERIRAERIGPLNGLVSGLAAARNSPLMPA